MYDTTECQCLRYYKKLPTKNKINEPSTFALTRYSLHCERFPMHIQTALLPATGKSTIMLLIVI